MTTFYETKLDKRKKSKLPFYCSELKKKKLTGVNCIHSPESSLYFSPKHIPSTKTADFVINITQSLLAFVYFGFSVILSIENTAESIFLVSKSEVITHCEVERREIGFNCYISVSKLSRIISLFSMIGQTSWQTSIMRLIPLDADFNSMGSLLLSSY